MIKVTPKKTVNANDNNTTNLERNSNQADPVSNKEQSLSERNAVNETKSDEETFIDNDQTKTTASALDLLPSLYSDLS